MGFIAGWVSSLSCGPLGGYVTRGSNTFAFNGVRVTRRRTTKQMLLDGVQSPVSGLRIWVPTVSVAVDSWVGEALLWTLDALIDCVRAERWEKKEGAEEVKRTAIAHWFRRKCKFKFV